jgi:GT2 family glycosyltransferase
MTASVIVLAWNGMSYLGDCLRAVLSQTYADCQVIVVDNGSTDGSADFVAQDFPQAQLIRNGRNLGFSAGMNVGLRAAQGDVMVLLNQDTQVRSDWLEKLVGAMSADASIGIAGCKILYPDGTLQHGGGAVINARGDTTHLGSHEPDHGQCDAPYEANFVTGAALGITRATLERIGPLDEGFFPAYYEDVDWCYRARAAGYRVLYVPTAVLIHHESPRLANLPVAEAHKFNYTFQQSRLRFVFKHWPVEKVMNEFLPQELAWHTGLGPGQEQFILSIRHAYLDSLLALGDLATWRQQAGVAGDVGELAAALMYLREACDMSRLWTRLDAPTAIAERDKLLYQLHTGWALKEQPFHSDAPLIGPAVARLREAVNNISTRWYALPLVQQQTEFNADVVTMLAAVESALAKSLASLETLNLLEARRNLDVAELVQELSTLAERLQAMERRLSEAEK